MRVSRKVSTAVITRSYFPGTVLSTPPTSPHLIITTSFLKVKELVQGHRQPTGVTTLQGP